MHIRMTLPDVLLEEATVKKLGCAFFTLTMLTLVNHSSWAEHQLSDLKVTASPPDSNFIPTAPSSTVSAADIRQTNSINTEEAVKYQPELVIRSRYIGDSNALVAIRDAGMSQSARSLVMVDGMLISNFLGVGYSYAPLWATTAPEEIESIQVLYGPFDAQYSGNTMGGAVLLRTRLPQQFEASIKGSAFVQTFHDFGESYQLPGYKASALVGDKQGAWHYRALVSRVDSQSHPQMFGIATPGGAGTTAVNGAKPYEDKYIVSTDSLTQTGDNLFKTELGYDLSPKLQLRGQLAYQQSSRDSLSPSALITNAQGQPVYSGQVSINGQAYNVSGRAMSFSDSDRLLTGILLQGQLNDHWSTASNLSWYSVLDKQQHSSGTNYTHTDNQGAGKLSEDQGSNWANLDLRFSRTQHGGLAGVRTNLGYHLDQYQTDEATFSLASWRQSQKTHLDAAIMGTTRTQAVFIQNEWALSSQLTLNLGVRQEYWQAFGGRLAKDFAGQRITSDYPKRNESATSPKLMLDYFISSDWQLSTMLARAVRFPTVGELYQGGIDNNGNFNPSFNPDLKAETGLHADIGLTHFLTQGQWRIDLWQNRIDDGILQQTSVLTGLKSYQNIDRTVSTGLSISGQWQEIGQTPLSLSANLAYTRPKIEQNTHVPNSEGKDLPRIPRWRGNLTTSYALHPLWQVSSALRYSSDPYDTLENTDGGLQGYGYTDEFLVWDAKLSFHQGQWSLAAGINNINDEIYYAYHPYPGRTFFMEAQWHAF